MTVATNEGRAGVRLRLAALGVLLAGVLIALAAGAAPSVSAVRAAVESAPVAAPLVFVAVYAALTVALVPGAIGSAAAGAVFGAAAGFVVLRVTRSRTPRVRRTSRQS